jgi:hypothetical protein
MTRHSILDDLVPATGGRARFVLVASLLAVVPSLAVFGLRVAMGLDTPRAPPGALDPAFIAYSVLVAPLLETGMMLALAVVLARLVPRRVALQIVLVAMLGALAHRIGGEWRQVLRTAWPMLVYAGSLVPWLRRRGAGDAYVVTALVHAAYNAAFFAAGIVAASSIEAD